MRRATKGFRSAAIALSLATMFVGLSGVAVWAVEPGQAVHIVGGTYPSVNCRDEAPELEVAGPAVAGQAVMLKIRSAPSRQGLVAVWTSPKTLAAGRQLTPTSNLWVFLNSSAIYNVHWFAVPYATNANGLGQLSFYMPPPITGTAYVVQALEAPSTATAGCHTYEQTSASAALQVTVLAANVCGNGVLNAGEACDRGLSNGSLGPNSCNLTCSGAAASTPNPANTITVKDKSGVASVNAPIQIARPFLPGEIRHFAQAVVNGVPVATQCDVKKRHAADGSVDHALVSFLIPALPANGIVTVGFQNQPTAYIGNDLTKSQMLASNLNFDAAFELTELANAGAPTGSPVTVSGRAMLQADAYQHWTKGPIAKSIVLDGFGSPAFRVGFPGQSGGSTAKPWNGLVYATFFPALNKTRVAFVGEITDTQALADLRYALALKTGSTNPATVYIKPSVTHYAMTRWTKEFWIGGAPPEVEINHNLNYLVQTGIIPKPDQTLPFTQAEIAYEYSLWANLPASQRDLYGAHNLDLDTEDPHQVIGPITQFEMDWALSGFDNRLLKKLQGNANASMAYPVSLREGSASRLFNTDTGARGFGRPPSTRGRPGLCAAPSSIFSSYFSGADVIVPIGATGTNLNGLIGVNPWSEDQEHVISALHYLLFKLTGDRRYKDQLGLRASFWSLRTPGGVAPLPWSRGPSGSRGFVAQPGGFSGSPPAAGGDARGQSWPVLLMAYGADVESDGSDVGRLLESHMIDNIAAWEGGFNITGTSLDGHLVKTWAAQVRPNFCVYQGYNPGLYTPQNSIGLMAPAVAGWDGGDGSVLPAATAASSYGLNSAVTARIEVVWMRHYMTSALGVMKRLGFPVHAVLARMAASDLERVALNPYLASKIRFPMALFVPGGGWFLCSTYFECLQGFIPSAQYPTWHEWLLYAVGGLSQTLTTSLLGSNGPEAWQAFDATVTPAARANVPRHWRCWPND